MPHGRFAAGGGRHYLSRTSGSRIDTAELVEHKKKEGELLLRALDSAGLPVTSAFWYRVPDTGEWRLVLASPIIREKGPDFAYEKIQRALSDPAAPKVQLTDIWLVKETGL